VGFNVLHPVADVVEGRFVCHVVHEQNPHRAPVVRCKKHTKSSATFVCCRTQQRRDPQRALLCACSTAKNSRSFPPGRQAFPMTALTAGDGAKSLLAGRVPDLKLDPLVVNQHFFDFEVDSARSATRVVRKHTHTLDTEHRGAPKLVYPIVVMKLDVKESSENRSKTQLFPTPGYQAKPHGLGSLTDSSSFPIRNLADHVLERSRWFHAPMITYVADSGHSTSESPFKERPKARPDTAQTRRYGESHHLPLSPISNNLIR
jgi:hypothetical protein